MISRETDYAIRAILYLAGNGKNKLISVSELSEKMKIPYRFLRKIAKRLVEEKILESRKGKNGGLSLLIAPEKLSLYDVANIFDSNGITLNKCLREKESCKFSGVCEVHLQLFNMQKELDRKLKKLTFKKLY